MYIAFIRPLLEYSDSVWDNSPTCVKKQVDDIHYEAARIITGGTKLPQEIKESNSVASFKYQLNKDTHRRAPPKFFLLGQG